MPPHIVPAPKYGALTELNTGGADPVASGGLFYLQYGLAVAANTCCVPRRPPQLDMCVPQRSHAVSCVQHVDGCRVRSSSSRGTCSKPTIFLD